MSEIRVTNILGENGNSPVNFTQGINMSGIVTATSFVPSQGQLSNRNKVINGAMTVSQRATSFTSDGYILDRFKRSQSSDGAFTVTQSTTSPDGFAKSLKVDVTTADTSLAAGQYAQIIQKIEAQNLQDLAYGTSSAKNIVVSFYVRSNKTGNYSFNIQQQDNSSKQVTLNYTINSANTWERKTFSIAGDTSGVINDDNGSGFQISWGLAYGSTYTSGSARPAWTTYADADFGAGQAINLLDSTSNEWYLTGVQLEVGPVATPFEHRSIGDELARCQRYCVVIGADQEMHLGTAHAYNSTNINLSMHVPVGVRVKPTASVVLATSGDNANKWLQAYMGASGNKSNASISVSDCSEGHAQMRLYLQSAHSGLSAGQALWCHTLPDAKLILSAEL